MDKCMWCEKPATRYCDAAIGFEAVAAVRDKAGNVTGLLAGGGKAWTCDAPVCGEHASMIGHVCGEEPDTIDRCPHHMEHPEKPMRELVMFECEADRRRREVHAEIRRALMKTKRPNAKTVGLAGIIGESHTQPRLFEDAKVGAGDTALDVHADLTLAAVRREVAK